MEVIAVIFSNYFFGGMFVLQMCVWWGNKATSPQSPESHLEKGDR